MIKLKEVDRSKAPEIKAIQKLRFPPIREYKLSNNIPVHEIRSDIQEAIKIELIFNAGRLFEKHKLVSPVCAQLLKEGSKEKSSREISEIIDFYGASVKLSSGMDVASIELYCLNKHRSKILPLLSEILNFARFPQAEIDHYIQNSKERLAINLKKNDVVAYRQLTEKIFGADHPYGFNSSSVLYDSINQAKILDHFYNCYGNNNCAVIVSGDVNDDLRGSLEDALSGFQRNAFINPRIPEATSDKPGWLYYDSNNDYQSNLRFGGLMFTRNHPDFSDMYILLTILGGYFGSRLMRNLREDKGYTYNIYSGMETMKKGAYYYITTDVGHQNLNHCIEEIFKEIKILKKEYVSDQELKMVKNYLMGRVMSMLDGPFRVSSFLKQLLIFDLESSHFEQFVNRILKITPEQILTMANQHLDEEKMWKVVVGTKKPTI